MSFPSPQIKIWTKSIRPLNLSLLLSNMNKMLLKSIRFQLIMRI